MSLNINQPTAHAG